MGSSSNVFMRWGGFILKVFMYLFNKKSRTGFGESVRCVSRKLWVFSVSLSSCLTVSKVVTQKGLVNQTPPNPHTPHSCPSYSAWARWPDGPSGQGHPDGCFLPHRSTPGYAASCNTQQTTSVLISHLSPDVFNASTTWACNREIFIAQRTGCRWKSTFRGKHSIEGYVVFAFLNASEKSKHYSWGRAADRPCLGTARGRDIRTCWTFACSRSPSFFTSSENLGLSLGLLRQQSSMIW